MRNLLPIAMISLLAPGLVMAEEKADGLDVSGQITAGAQVAAGDRESSKFNEYRDIDDDFYLYSLALDVFDEDSGYYFDLAGTNLIQDDRRASARGGLAGLFRLSVEWNEIPHNLSYRAQSPYTETSDGVFEVPATVPELYPGFFEKLATASADAPSVVASDDLVADYLSRFNRKVGLGTQRETGRADFDFSVTKNLRLRFEMKNEDRSGNKIGYGPIGDRPPRTLNIQFAEPVNYTSRDFKVASEYKRGILQLNSEYQLSRFDNDTDVVTWQNIFVDAPAGSTFATWDRAIGAYGRRPLSPDNWYHNGTMTAGLDLPFDSRLVATAGYSRMLQDEKLLPYSTVGIIDGAAPAVDPTAGLAWNDPAKLPRDSAEADIANTLFNADYLIRLLPRLNLRAFYRYYNLDNKTPMDEWRYVTQDTTNTNGTVSYKNKRINLAYAYEKQNYGADANYSLGFWRTNIGLGFEHEKYEREFREADTDENIYKLSLRSTPLKRLTANVKYRYGDRNAHGYNGDITAASYWYDPLVDTVDNDNPAVSFSNHPDTRRFDVSDRQRHKVDARLTVSALDNLDVSASFGYRNDDFGSGVRSTQPLAGFGGPDAAAATPGDQLGLLRDERLQYGLDVVWGATEQLTLSTYYLREEADSRQRGLEFNENNKTNPSSVAANELGPWTRATSQWIADIDDSTNTFGVGAAYAIIPKKLDFAIDYLFSFGKIEIDYSGFGTNSSLPPFGALPDNHEFGFRSPSDVNNDRHTLNASLKYQLSDHLRLNLGYLFEYYDLDDWQQAANSPWFESVNGNEHLLRDTSRSHQWGNRLVNLGSYLAPGYSVHVVSLSATYSF